ncbi:MAG: hypothetical protein HY784_18180, partial [Chloroflexi bacterium]|nr:hypothetical protein [Chloroflexota bacterium]
MSPVWWSDSQRKMPRARALLGLPPELPKAAKLVLAAWLESVMGEERGIG